MTILFEGKSEKMKMYSVCKRRGHKGKSKKTILRYTLKARTQYLYYTRECILITHTRTHTRFPAV